MRREEKGGLINESPQDLILGEREVQGPVKSLVLAGIWLVDFLTIAFRVESFMLNSSWLTRGEIPRRNATPQLALNYQYVKTFY
jgi:hypothetical protein